MGKLLRVDMSQVQEWFVRQSDNAKHCRSCGVEVDVLDKVCPRCEAADPAKIPVAIVAAMVGIPILIVLVYWGIKWM